MTDTQLLIIVIFLLIACLVLLLVILASKNPKTDDKRQNQKLDEISSKADRLGGVIDYTNQYITNMNAQSEIRMTAIQKQLTEDIKYISESNAKNIELIRKTVDETLSNTLEDRLSKSYEVINQRLEAVHKGIGEVHTLASSVSDVKKIFSNVKLRGTWGETQLNSILEQMLYPEQYERNFKVDPMNSFFVDFAVRVPAADGNDVWIPIDSKFPVEEYQRLVDANDKDTEAKCLKALERAVKLQADSIASKYIRPPFTTDFAIMYLPTEGLYAEVVKLPSLNSYLNERRVTACGPTNFGALLSTLQTGFKTAAIEKRSGELWKLLSTFKTEFARFNELLEKTSKKLQEAQDSIDSATKKTKTISRKLKDVDAINSDGGYGDGEIY